MMRYQARMHPTLDILCDSLGRVFVPQNHHYPAHWTFGSKDSKTGYRRVKIAGKNYRVSRLICETFHGLAPGGKPTCEHINRNRDCNVPENLMWADYKQQADNTAHVDRGISKYGVRRCEDSAEYQRAYRAKNHEFAERKRAKEREWKAQNAEHVRAYQREYRAKKALRLVAKEN